MLFRSRRSSSTRALTDAGGSSRGVPLTFRDLCACTYRVIGSRSRPGLALRRPSRSSGHTLPPGKSRLQLRSLLALRPLQSFTRAGRWPSREASPSLGVRSPFSACDRGSPPFPGLPRPVRCAFRVRQPSWRLPSAANSTALFHAAHARGSPFEAFPFARRGYASRRTLAHLPSARAAPGFRRMPRPAPGPCSPRKSVARASRGPAARPDAPLGFALSRGFLPVTTAAASRGPPPTSLAQASHPAPAPRSLDRGRAGSSPWRPPPLLRSLHLVPVPEGSRRPGPGSWFCLECG